MVAVEKMLIFVAFLVLFAFLALRLVDPSLSMGIILALGVIGSVAAAILLKRHMTPAMIILYLANSVLLVFKGGAGIYVAVFLLVPLLIFLRDFSRERADSESVGPAS